MSGPTVDAALQSFSEMIANDGYELVWSEPEPRQVAVTISAGPDACSDCLVPRPVMEAIMNEALSATDYRLHSVELPPED
jgi:hypothetical protein